MPSYIKAMRPVLEIFKMAEYFPDSFRKKKELRRVKLYNVRLKNLYSQRNIIKVDRLKGCAIWYADNESLA
jgi:isochorismate hydrolase